MSQKHELDSCIKDLSHNLDRMRGDTNQVLTVMIESSGSPSVFTNESCTVHKKNSANRATAQQPCATKSVNRIMGVCDEPHARSVNGSHKSIATRSRRHRQIEVEQVHKVYQQIAPYCDQVRQKAWPRVKRFLKDLQPGSLVADVGCGNGRYLNVNSSVLKFGCDICPPFLEQARGQGHEVIMGDNITLPYREAVFDAVISVGVIHHFASLERRVKALSELSRILCPGGRLMVYVWAFEQIHRKFESQDVLIPWVNPEVKEHVRKYTRSCSSEPDCVSSRVVDSSSCSANTPVHTFRRRQHERQKNNSSSSEKFRSKSLGDSESTADEHSLENSDSGIKKFGVFDRRDGTNQVRKSTKEDGTESKDLVNREASSSSGAGGNEGEIDASSEDLKTKTKWPNQLVSECRKLGKFLRSLSSRSDSQSNGDGDEDSARTTDTKDEAQLECYTNVYPVKHALHTAGSYNKIRSRRLGSTVYIHNSGATSTMSQNDEANTVQQLCNHHRSITANSAKEDSYSDIGPTSVTSNDYSYDNYDESSVAISAASNHSVDSVSSSPAYATVINKAAGKHRTHKMGHLTHTSDRPDRVSEIRGNKRIDRKETGSNLASLPFPTPVLTSSSADESDGASSENQNGNNPSVIILPGCSGSGKVGKYSKTSINVPASDTVTSGEFKSHFPDKIVRNITLENKADNDLNTEDTHEVIVTQNLLFSYGSDSEQTALTTRSTTSDCYSRGKVHEDLASAAKTDVEMVECQQYFSPTGKNCENIVPSFGTRQDLPLTGEASTRKEGSEQTSDLRDATDSVRKVFSTDQEKTAHDSNVHCQNRDTDHELHVVKDFGNSHGVDLEYMKVRDFKESRSHDVKDEDFIGKDNENTNGKCRGVILRRDEVPNQVTFKTLLRKLADIFNLRPENDSKTYGCYHTGKRRGQKFMTDSDSSDIETPESNFSTHSSCYPGLFAVSRESDQSDKHCLATGKDKRSNQCDIHDKSFEFISRPTSVSENGQTRKRGSFQSPHNQPHASNTESVGDLSAKKESFAQILSQKLSSLFMKGNYSDVLDETCQHYSPMMPSISGEKKEPREVAVLHNDDVTNPATNQTLGKTVVKRPNSLDFSKKRTRTKGRRPAPRRETKENRAKEYKAKQNKAKEQEVKNEILLTLSDAMTLLGDGEAEDSVVKRLDDSAKNIFAEMKRMNFAIRKFPMSSMDSDSNDDVAVANTGNTSLVDNQKPATEDQRRRPLTRRDKQTLYSSRAFSEAIPAPTGRAKRRTGLSQRQKERKEGDCIKREKLLLMHCFSEDYTCASDALEMKDDSLLMFSHSPNIKVDRSAPSETHSSSLLLGSKSHSGDNPDNHRTTADAVIIKKSTEPRTVSLKYEEENNSTSEHDSHSATTHTLHSLCDTVKTQVDNERNQSGDRFNINQSYTDNGNSIPNSSASSLDRCNQFTSDTPPSRSLHCNSTNQNTETKMSSDDQSKSDNRLSRYYHVFKKGELDLLVTNHVPSLKIVDTFYDHANWCIIAEKK